MNKRKSMRQKTFSGLIWSFTDLMANQGIQFIIQIVLARLLLPEHFGLIGMVLVFMAISQSIIDSGFTQALIRKQDANQADYSTVFYFNIIVSCIIYGLLFFLSPFIADFYSEPQLIDILRVLSLGIIFSSFAVVPRAILIKEVNFKVQAKINVVASIVSGIIAILLALVNFGVWSLVLRTLLMNVIQTVYLLTVKRWRPALVFSMDSFKELFGFGSKLLVSGLIDTIYKNIYSIIIGRLYTSTQLGYYTNASKLRDFASQTLTSTIQRVTYPILSSIQEEEERLKSSYRKTLRTAAYVMFPLTLGLMAIADPLIRLLFGEQWVPMILYFQLLAFAGMLYPIHAINLNVLQVKGRSDLFLYLEILKKLTLTILIAGSVYLNLGVIGLIVAAIIGSYFALIINTHFSGKEIEYPLSKQIKDLFPSYALSILMGVITYLIGYFLEFGNLITIVIQIAVGVVLYISCSIIFKVKEFFMLYEMLINNLKKK